MFQGTLIVLISLGYVGILFAIAYYGDKRADAGRSIIANPYVYALSMAVYCTAWTLYGSVGRAAQTGLGFLPIYLGPTLMAALWWFVLRKIIRISKSNRITSIADFIASRYGKSGLLGGLVTVIAVVGVVPYIALQLKAVTSSFDLLWRNPGLAETLRQSSVDTSANTAFYVAMLLAAFAILFGTRHLDVTEHHEGLVAAIAFESVVKLFAFLAVGLFVTYGVYNGFTDIVTRAAAKPELMALFTIGTGNDGYTNWASLLFLSMMAILFLPRQFQMAVVENVDETHLNKAIWLFPLYLLAINLFVLPIAFGGLLHFPDGAVDADTFVITVPMAEGQIGLALLVFLGGFSAAASMVIVETVALSTMVSNDLIMPLLLRLRPVRVTEQGDLGRLLLAIRRVSIVAILLLGYLYFRLIGQSSSLVSIGLISFAAVAQFAPAILGGIYWKGGTRLGALSGLVGGFLLWGYTLPLPSLAEAGGLPMGFVETGLGGIHLLRPYALLGLHGLDPISHSLFWSMVVNLGLYVTVSLVGRQSVREHGQATIFVDVATYGSGGDQLLLWRGTATVVSLHDLLVRFLGEARSQRALTTYARQRGLDLATIAEADAELVQHAERLLAGSIGAASARVAIASVVKEEALSMHEVMRMLDETSQIIAYSHQLEQRSQQLEEKSLALEAASTELRTANERLQELDRMKDDFISTVTHELRTPLTSIRAFSEILHDNPQLDLSQRTNFLEIILKESERLTRLINQVLDLAKLESGAAEWVGEAVDLAALIQDVLASTSGLLQDKGVQLQIALPDATPPIFVDRDRITQVLLNLFSNAIKFCQTGSGEIRVAMERHNGQVQVRVTDNGPGISLQEQAVIFDKFRQVSESAAGKPQGTGLGLPISMQIITHYGGDLWVESEPGNGATFCFTLPLLEAEIDGMTGWQDDKMTG